MAARARHRHAVLVLVVALVAGGMVLRAPEAKARPGDWAATAPLERPRAEHTATLLTGNDCTKTTPPEYCGKVVVAGGSTVVGDEEVVTGTAELYDPVAAKWSSVAPMSIPRSGHIAAVSFAGSQLVVAGGRTVDGRITDSVEVFDFATKAWRVVAPMRIPRVDAAVIAIYGRVVVMGGRTMIDGTEQITDAVEEFNFNDQTWAPKGPLGVSRAGHAAVHFSSGGPCTQQNPNPPPNCEKVFVIGGVAANNELATVTELYDVFAENGTYEAPDCRAIPQVSNPPQPVEPLTCKRLGATTFTVGRLAVPRPRSHTATVLIDGRVLVTGGEGAENSSELWRPVQDGSGSWSDVWEPTADMEPGRSGHTAVRLPDGRVLVTGGTGARANALYDPPEVSAPASEGIWRPAGELQTVRSGGHTATLLDTRVLVVGGSSPNGLTASVETYQLGNPRKWTRTPPLNLERTYHTATVLDGPACRGTDPPAYCGNVLGAGGSDDPRSEVYIYDQRSSTGTWSFTGALNMPRRRHTATLLDPGFCRAGAPPSGYPCGKVLVAGGTTSSAGTTASSELFDPAATVSILPGSSTSTTTTTIVPVGVPVQGEVRPGRWTASGELTYPRSQHTATLLDGPACRGETPPSYCGKVLVVGGVGPVGSTEPVPVPPDVPEPAPDQVEEPVERAADQMIQGPLATAELYDPVTGAWAPAPDLPDTATTADGARFHHTATALDGPACRRQLSPEETRPGYCGKVLIAGGRGARTNVSGTDNHSPTGSAWLYEPTTNSWVQTGSLTFARLAHAATGLDGPACEAPDAAQRPGHCDKVLVAGGRRRVETHGFYGVGTTEFYDPASGKWSRGPEFDRMGEHTVTALPQGVVLAAGGLGAVQGGSPTSTPRADLFDAATGLWSQTVSLPVKAAGHTATLLADGQILVAGGATASSALYDAVFPPDPPASVQALQVGADAAKVDWVPPVRDGGSPVIGYRVTGPGTGTKVRDPLDTSVVLRGMPADAQQWQIEVRAVTRGGEGQPKSFILVLDKTKIIPDAPTAVVATPLNGAARVEWSAPAENGSNITGYRISTRSRHTTAAIPVAMEVTGKLNRSATVTGLQDGMPYRFVVHALSPIGAGLTSTPSNEVVPGLPKGQPKILSASPRSRSVLLTWAAPPDPGGAAITTYAVTVASGGAVTGEVSIPVGASGPLAAVVPGLTNGTPYTFSLRAINSVGASEDESPASPAVVPVLGATAALPSTPAALVAPTVISVYPRGGPVTGGIETVISGSGFGGNTEVRFGHAPAQFRVVSDHQLVAVLPAYAEGPVGISVTNGVGGSPKSDAAVFHYGEGGWQLTGTRPNATSPGIATLLPSGKVLVTTVAKGAPAAELYDPMRGTWSAAAPPPTAPSLVFPLTKGPHSGKLLTLNRSGTAQCTVTAVVGFYQDCKNPLLPDIFDPSSGNWGKPNADKHKATAANGAAAVLSDGSILVAGGCCEPETGSGLGPYHDRPLSPAEVYDPETGTWAATGSLALPRDLHTLTELKGPRCGDDCGKVLAVGGYRRTRLSESYGPNNPEPMLLTPPEIWDPESGRWSPAQDMKHRRFGHTATPLADGRILVVGGSLWKTRDEGFNGSQAFATSRVEIYDPQTRAWSAGAPLPEPRFGHAAVVLPNGRILVTGGLGPDGPLTTAELYDPALGRWISAGHRVTGGGRTPVVLPEQGACGANCGKVLMLEDAAAAGRATIGAAELYTPPPSVTAVGPTEAPATGGVDVKITGDGLDNDAEVRIGGAPATVRGQPGHKELVAVAPAPAVARAPVEVTTTGGTALSATAFVYRGAPGAVSGLTARSTSRRAVELSFGAAGSVLDAAPAANDYLIRYSRTPITDDASFDAGRPLCAETGDVCSYTPNQVGQEITVAVGALASDTRYHFAIRARNGDGLVGDLRTTSVRTPRFAIPAVGDLAAVARSSSEIALTFSPVGLDGGGAPLARDYVVKQSTTPMLDLGDFESARTLCGGVCTPDEVDGRLSLKVTGLKAGATYYYAVRASDDTGNLGPMSNLAEATTLGPCPAISDAGPGQARYTRGYHLVGVPERTFLPVPALFGWFDRNSGAYSTHEPSAPVAGHGYWAWFACDSVVDLGAGGQSSLKLPLGEYRASMVGNPSSTAAATVSGHDFAATWDPSLNGGSGGYKISRYRERQILLVGAGSWVFSYATTTISIETM